MRVWNIFGNDGEQFVPSVCPAADTPATLLEDGEECLACVITRWGRRKFKRFFYNCGKLYICLFTGLIDPLASFQTCQPVWCTV